MVSLKPESNQVSKLQNFSILTVFPLFLKQEVIL